MDLIDVLRRILVDELFVDMDPEAIGPDDSLATEIGLDSVGFIELWGVLEEKFGIQILDTDTDESNFSTLSRLAAYIESRQSEKRR